jgi:hypothetical protein
MLELRHRPGGKLRGNPGMGHAPGPDKLLIKASEGGQASAGQPQGHVTRKTRHRVVRHVIDPRNFAASARPCRAGVPTQSPAAGAPAAPRRGAALDPNTAQLGNAELARAGELAQVTRCLEVRFTQRVNQPMPRSEAVLGVRE